MEGGNNKGNRDYVYIHASRIVCMLDAISTLRGSILRLYTYICRCFGFTYIYRHTTCGVFRAKATGAAATRTTTRKREVSYNTHTETRVYTRA